MSRLYTNSPRGRQPLLGSTVKFSKSSKQHPNDTYQPNGKKSKSIRAATVTKKSIGKRKREDTPASGHSSATFCGFDSADDASDEDSEEDLEDEDNLPAVKAPSRSRKVNVAGRKPDPIPDNVSVAGSDNMFGGFDNYYEDDEDPNFSPEENRKRFEEKIFADSDDDGDIDVYQAVDDISDSDDDLDEQRIQDQEVLAMLPEDVFSDTDFLNQIDGMSAYGFGNDSDTSIYRFPSSQDGDSATEGVAERHVHFAADADPTLFMRLSASPTITRALLPSALPDTGSSAHSTAPRVGGLVDDLDDCTLQRDLLPYPMTNVVQPILPMTAYRERHSKVHTVVSKRKQHHHHRLLSPKNLAKLQLGAKVPVAESSSTKVTRHLAFSTLLAKSFL